MFESFFVSDYINRSETATSQFTPFYITLASYITVKGQHLYELKIMMCKV